MFPCDSAHASFSGVVTTIGPRLIEGLVETFPARPRHPVQATGTAGRLRRSACSPLCHSLREDNQGDCLDRASACPGEVCPRREPTPSAGDVPPSPWPAIRHRGRAGNVSTSPSIKDRFSIGQTLLGRSYHATRPPLRCLL